MLDMALAAHSAWREDDGTAAMNAAEREGVSFRGERSSAKDYRLDWPEPGDSSLTISFYPDVDRGLRDPRIRTLEFDLRTGEYEVSDSYPLVYHWVVYSVFAILAGCAFLFVRWGARPLQKTRHWDRRMAVKKHGDEDVAVEYMARVRSR